MQEFLDGIATLLATVYLRDRARHEGFKADVRRFIEARASRKDEAPD